VGLCWFEMIGLQLWQPFFLTCLLLMCINEFFNRPICVANLNISSLSSSFSVCRSIVSSHISFISYDIIPLACRLLSQWSPWPFNTLTTFEPKTKAMVTEVLSCVRINPNVYLKFGPMSGNKKKLQQTKFTIREDKSQMNDRTVYDCILLNCHHDDVDYKYIVNCEVNQLCFVVKRLCVSYYVTYSDSPCQE